MRQNTLILLLLFLFTLQFQGCKEGGGDGTKEVSTNRVWEAGIDPKMYPDQPNFIFFITDDMYPNMFNILRETKTLTFLESEPNLTPTLDKLILEGVWLDNMKVVSPVCTPSRYNVLTGNYASRSVWDEFLKMREENDGQTVIQWNSFITPGVEKTMGAYFQELGYKTGFVGKNHVIAYRPVPGRNRGMSFFADPKDPDVIKELELRHSDLQAEIIESGFDYADGLYHNNPDWIGVKALASHNMDWIVSKGLDFIEMNKREPFLLYIATTIPHGPTVPYLSWKVDRRITPIGILEEAPQVMPQFSGKLGKYDQERIAQDPGLEPSVRNYVSIEERLKKQGLDPEDHGNLLWLDDALSTVFKKLEDENLLKNTIIVFFNDHGQAQKGTLYEGGISTEAFIWKYGGFEIGSHLNTPVSNVDLLPTLMEMAGVKDTLNTFDGYSFKSALDGERYNTRNYTYHELGYARAIVKDGYKYYAVRYPEWATKLGYEGRKKLLDERNDMKRKRGIEVINEDPMAPFGQLVMVPGGELAENPSYTSISHYHDPDQFFDLNRDPEETENLIDDPEYADKILELKELLQKEVERLPGTFPVKQSKGDTKFLD